MLEYVHLNGRLTLADDARISVFDAGFTHAAGLFETMRAYGGRVMRFADHWERLTRSADALEMAVQGDRAILESAVHELLQANQLRDARIRLVVTPGPVPRASQADPLAALPTLLITASPVQVHPPELYQMGMRVCICPYKQHRQDPLAGHKTLAYLPRLLAMKHAAALGCHESLWMNADNQLAEGSVCNVFIVQEDKLLTPPENTPILPGTVRKAVIDLARQIDLPLEQQPIDINALLAAHEVFLTGSVLEIMPVTSIEKHIVGNGVPGPMTQRLSALYSQLVARECGLDG